MSNNITNKDNKQYKKNKSYNNFDKTKKQPKINPNEFKLPLYLSADLSEKVTNEIIDVLSNTKFDKVSIPLSTYKTLMDSNVDETDTRVCTIGYIRKYDSESKCFTVIVFNNFVDLIKEFGDSAIVLQFTTHKENLGTITRFNVCPVLYDDSEIN